ncbi:MAG: HD domain-containing protein [Actinomycetota bacterium]|jgi:putative nucleotidyltransferase with HDIG domain|nr:HD domain-containing protein [Actinomycetota bacterium]
MAEFGDVTSWPREHRGLLLTTLNQVLAVYDPVTASHAERVAEISFLVAAELDLADPERELAQISGIVHDIGKLKVSRGLLNKSSALTADERSKIEAHCEIGAEILLAISSDFGLVAEGVRSHHERLNGAGYPSGLSGEEIPLMARLLAVVDVYDAMTNQRAYRKRIYSSGAASEYLVGQKGSEFDPECVDATMVVLGGWLSNRRVFSLSPSSNRQQFG